MAASCFTEVGSEGTFHPQEDAVNLLAKRALAASASSFEGVLLLPLLSLVLLVAPPPPAAAADYYFCIAAQTAAYNTSTRTMLSIAAGYHRHEYYQIPSWFQYFVTLSIL